MMKRATKTILITMLFAIVLSSVTFAQSFVVQPMKLEYNVKPGEIANMPFSMRNYDEENSRTIDLTIVDLTQGDNANLVVIDLERNPQMQPSYSCKQWVELSEDVITMEPLGKSQITVTVKPPAGSKGFYCAGLVAKSRPEQTGGTLALTVRFVIPILVVIDGRSTRQNIDLVDVDMLFNPQNEYAPASSIAKMIVTNNGLGYSRLTGHVRISKYTDGHLRTITKTDFRKVGILPGLEIPLYATTQRNLPSGMYQLEGILYVDGRRIKPLVRDIEYTGDPQVVNVIADNALILDPLHLEVDAIPGSTRTTILQLENTSNEDIVVQASTSIPQAIKGRAMGEMTGPDIACHKWLTVRPQRVTVRSGRRQNMRVTVRLPKNKKQFASYYANLDLQTAYASGQNAGDIQTLVCVHNPQQTPTTMANVNKLDIANGVGDNYVVTATFANVGNTYYNPQCKVSLLKPKGKVLASTTLRGEEKPMLPLETRDYSGELVLRGVDVGTYLLRLEIDCGQEEPVQKEKSIRILVENDKRIAEFFEDTAS